MKEPRSNPELEARLVEAHAKGTSIEDLKYDEVTGFLDVVLTRAKRAAAEGSEQVRQAAQSISRSSGTGLRRIG